jgi:hypothetical protein
MLTLVPEYTAFKVPKQFRPILRSVPFSENLSFVFKFVSQTHKFPTHQEEAPS